ncbi:MAG: TonB-dependent receptor [Alloprevotella sp.]|nr:TonB-dependent receptor [Alloprevotella sp.]
MQAQTPADSTDVFYDHVVEGEAVVTGLTGRTRLKDSPAPVLLILANELKQSTGTHIVDILSRQPGLSQVSTGTGIGKPIIRGLGYNRMVSLNDGVRLEGQQWGDEHGLEVDGSSIHSVEVLKGPASLMYGSDAMAGVVIFHATPVRAEGEMGGSALAEYQSNSGLWNYAVHFDGNRRGWVWNTNWSQKRSHAYKNKSDGYVPGTQWGEYAARAMMGLHKAWGHSYLVLSTYNLTPSITEGERDETAGLLFAPAGWTGKSYGKSLPFQRVRHHKVISDNSFRLSHGTLNAVLGYQQNRRQEFEENLSDSELFFLLHTLTYDFRFLTADISGWKLAAGANGMYQRSLNKGEEVLIPAYHLFDFGTYLTGSRRLGSFLFSGGIRYDRRHLHSEGLEEDGIERFEDFSRQFHGVTGSLGAVWSVRNNLNLRFNLARGYRAPSISELGVNGVHEGTLRYESGSSTLRPEYSLQADAGLDFTNRYLSLQAAFFVNRINHYIYATRTGTEIGGYAVYQYAQGNARLYGFELGLDYHPIHSLHLLNTFSYVNSVQLHQPLETRYLPLTPAPRWTAEVKWEILHDNASLGQSPLALTGAYLSANMACYLRQNHYYRANKTETATPSYTLFGLSAGTALLWQGRKVADVCLTVENLFDRLYQDHLSRLKYAAVNPLTHSVGIHNPGRNISLRLIVPF